jgi:hypothetical protein
MCRPPTGRPSTETAQWPPCFQTLTVELPAIPQEFFETATERDAWAKQEHDKLKTRLTAGARARVPTVAELKRRRPWACSQG